MTSHPEATAHSARPVPGRQAWIWFKRLVRLVIVALVVWGIGHTVQNARRDLATQQRELEAKIARAEVELAALPAATSADVREAKRAEVESLRSQRIRWSRVRFDWLVLSGLAYLGGTIPAWWFWHRTLHSFGQSPHLMTSLRAYTIGHLGKYVPGKALVVILRASLVKGPHVETWTAVAAVFIETLTLIAVGAVLSALLLPVAFGGLQHPLWMAGACGLALLVGLPTVPPVFRAVVMRLMRNREARDLSASLRGLHGRLMLTGWLAMAVVWCFWGASLWFVVRAIPGDPRGPLASLADFPLLTACVALAMVLGFVSLIPGGLGVRELVMTTLLAPQPHYGTARALGAAVLLRLVWLLSELALSGVLVLVRPASRPSTGDRPAPLPLASSSRDTDPE